MVSFLEPLVCAFRFPIISTSDSLVNFVDDDMFKLALMLIIWMAVSDEHLYNMEIMSVTFEVSNCGMVVRFEQ